MISVRAVGKSCWGARTKGAVQLLGGVFAILLLCMPAFSQGSFGRILGTVTDQSGGVVVGATVTVIDTERGISRTLTTDDAGAYNAPNLTAGNYTVRAEAKGFKTFIQKGLQLRISDRVELAIKMEIGQVTETITVNGGTPLLEVASASTGSVVDHRSIVELPVSGGNALTASIQTPASAPAVATSRR